MKGLEMKLSTLSLDHLGLVASIFDALGISEVIDESIPKTRNCKLSHSAIIKGTCSIELPIRPNDNYK